MGCLPPVVEPENAAIASCKTAGRWAHARTCMVAPSRTDRHMPACPCEHVHTHIHTYIQAQQHAPTDGCVHQPRLPCLNGLACTPTSPPAPWRTAQPYRQHRRAAEPPPSPPPLPNITLGPPPPPPPPPHLSRVLGHLPVVAHARHALLLAEVLHGAHAVDGVAEHQHLLGAAVVSRQDLRACMHAWG